MKISDSAGLAPVQSFWRDAALPFIEAREVADGRNVCYDRHAHDTFSIGAITAGACTYLNGRRRERAASGTVVLMNPGEVHACNPLDGAWSYLMLYVDSAWLAGLQGGAGNPGEAAFRPMGLRSSDDPALYAALCGLHAILIDAKRSVLEKELALRDFFHTVLQVAGELPTRCAQGESRLGRAAEFIRTHCTQSLSLDDICVAAELSASYLVRAFKSRYLMTPHEYLVNCRIQHCRQQLREGLPIAQVAADAGFADQAHFQRAFKRYVAATPGLYRGALASRL
jgi:AraC-like DNA-binding protein